MVKREGESTLQVPYLCVWAKGNGRDVEEDLTVHYSLHWEKARNFGPQKEPEWLADIRQRTPYEYRGKIRKIMPQRAVLKLETRQRLSTLLGQILKAAKPRYNREEKEEASKEILRNLIAYSQCLTAESGIPTRIINHLKEYSKSCEKHSFPPILTIQTNFPGLLWNLATLPGQRQPLDRLWCRRLALGFRDTDQVPVEVARKSLSHIAVATRMVPQSEKNLDLKQADTEGSAYVEQIERILHAWDPWDLSSKTDDITFGIFCDLEKPNWDTELAMLSDDAAPLVIYHGHKEADIGNGEGVRCHYVGPQPSDGEKLDFTLQKLGSQQQTLLLAACSAAGIGEKRDFVGDLRNEGILPSVRTLSAARQGGAWIGTPLAIDYEEGLRFARYFLQRACTRGAPIAELLRVTIDQLARSWKDGYAWYTFLLHGDSQRLLPFVTKQRMYFHSTPEANSVIKELADALRSNPIIPIDPVSHSTITGMDSDFLRALGLEAEGLAPSPLGQVWPVSVAAVGRALAHPQYPAEGRRLKILCVAVYSQGGCKLIGWDPEDPERPIEEVAEVRRVVRQPGAILKGFVKESFEATLARMCMSWWAKDEAEESTKTPKRAPQPEEVSFYSAHLREQLQLLQTKAASGAIFWGGDLLTLEKARGGSILPGRLVKRFNSLNSTGHCLDLEGEMWDRFDLEPRWLPVILLVTIEDEEEGQGDYFFAYRELLRTFRGLDVDAGGYLKKGKPSYFRSVDPQDLEAISFFIAQALAFRLWDDPIDPRFRTPRLDDLRGEVYHSLDRALYLPQERVRKSVGVLRERLAIDPETDEEVLLRDLEKLMWDDEAGSAVRRTDYDRIQEVIGLLRQYRTNCEAILEANPDLKFLRNMSRRAFRSWTAAELEAGLEETEVARLYEALHGLVPQADDEALSEQLARLGKLLPADR